jgi:hypothetical protein
MCKGHNGCVLLAAATFYEWPEGVGREGVMNAPLTVAELRERCRTWPTDIVRPAVIRAFRDLKGSRAEIDALAHLVAVWLTESGATEPPPLASSFVQEIWRELSGRVQ